MRSIRAVGAAVASMAVVAAGVVIPLSVATVSAANTGTISGTVTVPVGVSPVGVRVVAQLDEGSVGGNSGFGETTINNPSGTYTIEGLGVGNFKVEFIPLAATKLVPEWWDNKSLPGTADPVALTDGEARTGIDAALAQGYLVSGTVTGPDNLPLAGATVTVNPHPTAGSGGTGAGSFQQVTTAADGTYTVGPLLPNSYRVEFSATGLESERYNNVFTQSDNPVVVSSSDVTAINARLEASTPSAPQSVVATPGNGQVALTWSAPLSSGANGGVISGYTATASPGGATCTDTAPPLGCTITGLTNGTAYTFTVVASNTGSSGNNLSGNPMTRGNGTAANAGPVTPAMAPGAPTAVTGSAGDGQVAVSWTAPASNGGSAITGYTVTASPGGATCTTTGATNCIVSGLTNGTAYTFTVTATNAAGTSAPSAASAAVTPQAGAGNLVSLTPARLMETRSGLSTTDGQFNAIGVRAGGSETALTVTGRGGVAADASAVVLNVTVTEPVLPGFITVWPCGETRPNASSVNFVAGQTVANAVTAKVGTNGQVCFFTNVATHLVVDVAAAYPAAASFASLTPARLMETRSGLSTTDGQFNAIGVRAGGSETALTVTGRGGVAADASAVVLNVTVTEPVLPGFITVWPCGEARPNASSVNFVAGQTVANAVTAKVGTNGQVCFFTNVGTHLVVDVTGAFPAG